MALWQFDFYIVPKKNSVRGGGSNEDILSWKQDNISSLRIDFLEEKVGWTKDIVQYGGEDETCIQFLYKDETLVEINCRFDLRSLSKKMLEAILDYVQNIEGMIFYEGEFYPPSLSEIVKLMESSEANRFCQNPTNYVEEFFNT